MYENMDEKTENLTGGNSEVSDQTQLQKTDGEDEQEYNPNIPHTHIDENGHIYTHTHSEEHAHLHDHEHGEGHGHSHGGHEHHTHSHSHGGHEHHEHSHSHDGHSHHHVHSAEEKRAVLNRLSRAIGHLESVKRMVERDEDCSEVLIQLAAVRNAINNTGKVIMKNHISHCMVEAIEQNDLEAVDALTHAIDHFIK